MRPLRQLSFVARALFRGDRKQDDLNEEVRIHLEMLIEDYVAEGMTRKAARKAAMIEFGGVERVKEDCRASWGVRLVSETFRDIKYGLHQLLRNKGFAAITLLTLSLCIGANAALFSLVHDLLIRPHNYPDYDRVVNIGMQWRQSPYGDAVLGMSPRRYLDIEDAASSYDTMGFISFESEVDLHSAAGVFRTSRGSATPGAWSTAGVSPVLGRTFTQQDIDEGNTRIAVISHRLWKRLFNKDENALGSEIKLDDRTYRIIGVMPKDFRFISYFDEVWVPHVFSEWERSENSRRANSRRHIARLKNGVTLDQAQSELEAIYASSPAHQDEVKNWPDEIDETYGVVLAKDYLPRIVPMAKAMFLSAQGAAVLLLAIGCFNVGALILVRNYHRSAEISMRHSLGARRSRIFRQLISETVALFLLAGLLSLPFAHGILHLLGAIIPDQTPIELPSSLSGATLVAVFLATLACSILFGSLPAWHVIRAGLREGLQSKSRAASASRKAHWMQSSFIVAQISITFILLVSTLALLKNLAKLQDRDFGFALENRIFATVTMPQYQFPDKASLDAFRQDAKAKLAAIPGVEKVGFSSAVPLSPHIDETSFKVYGYEPGPNEQSPHGNHYQVSDSYFSTMNIRLLRGRQFNASDGAPDAEPVAIVSESVSRKNIQNREAIGARIRWRGKDYEIVGIVNDTIDYAFYLKEAEHTVYIPTSQYPHTGNRKVVFAIQAERSPLALGNAIRDSILQASPDLASIEITTPKDHLRFASGAQQFPAKIAFAFAAFAMILSLLGIYGIVSFMVAERRREFGIRIALGADARTIARRIFWWSGRLAGIGIAAGMALAIAAMRLWGTALADSQIGIVNTIAPTSILLAATAVLAAYIPVRNATRDDPMNALRVE